MELVLVKGSAVTFPFTYNLKKLNRRNCDNWKSPTSELIEFKKKEEIVQIILKILKTPEDSGWSCKIPLT